MQFWSGTPFMKTTEIVAVARMFDEAGYDGLICSDHLIYPRELSSPYPDSPTGRPGWPPETAWPDSWVLIGAMAAVTRRLRFSNAVYIAPARPLLEVAKQVATASVLSEGRVSLGVGVGWMREEYELLGQDFDTRGKRLNEMIPALRELCGAAAGCAGAASITMCRIDDRTASRGAGAHPVRR
jgi:alkanesulfonate monooxygenase SsuD/methylene tetrahydromethanopterin reductase-like flavin-dependent oxidoreductase (luciferase family)